MGDRTTRFTPSFLEQLTALHLAAGHMSGAGRPADRTAAHAGSGSEFADHREYIPGDDPRQIDWRLYGRSGRFFTKLYHAEEDRTVAVALDCSASMGSAPGKFAYAADLAAALSFVALSDRDAVSLYLFREHVMEPLAGLRGTASFPRLLERLDAAEAAGRTDLSAAVGEAVAHTRRRGLLVVISDFMDGANPGARLGSLCAPGLEAATLQVFAPAEREPPQRGVFRIVDAETGQSRALTLDRGLARRYTRTFDAYADDLAERCRTLGVHHTRLSTDIPLEEAMLQRLRAIGLAA